jgi:hypothetical protein
MRLLALPMPVIPSEVRNLWEPAKAPLRFLASLEMTALAEGSL